MNKDRVKKKIRARTGSLEKVEHEATIRMYSDDVVQVKVNGQEEYYNNDYFQAEEGMEISLGGYFSVELGRGRSWWYDVTHEAPSVMMVPKESGAETILDIKSSEKPLTPVDVYEY